MTSRRFLLAVLGLLIACAVGDNSSQQYEVDEASPRRQLWSFSWYDILNLGMLSLSDPIHGPCCSARLIRLVFLSQWASRTPLAPLIKVDRLHTESANQKLLLRITPAPHPALQATFPRALHHRKPQTTTQMSVKSQAFHLDQGK